MFIVPTPQNPIPPIPEPTPDPAPQQPRGPIPGHPDPVPSPDDDGMPALRSLR